MLAVTEKAIATIRDLTDAPDVPAGAGLRIATDPRDGSLSFRLAATPWQGDEVLARSGALLFLDHEAVILLSDKKLDAVTRIDGQVPVRHRGRRRTGLASPVHRPPM